MVQVRGQVQTLCLVLFGEHVYVERARAEVGVQVVSGPGQHLNSALLHFRLVQAVLVTPRKVLAVDYPQRLSGAGVDEAGDLASHGEEAWAVMLRVAGPLGSSVQALAVLVCSPLQRDASKPLLPPAD